MKKPINQKQRSLSNRKKAVRQTTPLRSNAIRDTNSNAFMHAFHVWQHKRKLKRHARARVRAERLAGMPKSRVKRFFYRLHPKRLYRYWFSRQGLLMAIKLAGVGFAAMVIFVLGVFAYYRRELPNPREISSRILNQSTKFYDRTGDHLLFEVYGDENRTVVPFDKISDNAKHATVAIEDRDFYNHGGVSFRGIFRAAVNNVRNNNETVQGGSTITQQFIKNSLLSTEQTIDRKIKEVILAIELERLYSKDEILAFYLNEIPYGPQEYGIEAAAQSFFGKPASELSISESALLAALPQAPTLYSPYGENVDLLLERQKTIIDQMYDQGYITKEESTRAKASDVMKKIVPISKRSLYANIVAPHFVLEAQNRLFDMLSKDLVTKGGLKVITTIDLDLQNIAERAVKEADGGDGFCDRAGRCGNNAALVATDVESGQVIAMVGSRDFNYPKYGAYNAALSERQPGSSFKPYDYAQLFTTDRWGPDSYIYDVNQTWPGYSPKNFDFGYRGRMQVRQAIGESRNIPAVKAADIAGIDNVAKLAIAMGNKALEDDPSYDLSYALGAGGIKLAEHTQAYGTFARGGKYLEQAYILSIENADGESLYKWEKAKGEQVLDEQVAYLVTNMLTDDVARSGTFGLGNPDLVVPGLKHAVKTGTTDRSVDGLVMGYSAYMSVGVWVGNEDNTPMDSLTSQQTGPIFTRFLREAHEFKKYDMNKEIQARPKGIKEVVLDSDTGYVATDKTKNKRIGLFPSWFVPETSDTQNKYTIDKVSGLKATDCTPERAKEERTGGGLWPEVPPDDYRFSSWSKVAGYGGGGSGPTKDDNVHKCTDELPDVSLSVNKLSDGVYEFEADTSRGTHNLGTLNFIVNGQTVSSINLGKNGGTETYVHVFSGDGEYTITAEVIDKALYDNSAKRSINVNGVGSQSFEITSHSNGQNNVSTNSNFSWDSYSVADSYNFCLKKSSQATFDCFDNGLSTSYMPGLDGSSTYDIKIQAEYDSSVIRQTSVIRIRTN